MRAQREQLRLGHAKRRELSLQGRHLRGLQQALASRQPGGVQLSIQAGWVLIVPERTSRLHRDHGPHLSGQRAEPGATHRLMR